MSLDETTMLDVEDSGDGELEDSTTLESLFAEGEEAEADDLVEEAPQQTQQAAQQPQQQIQQAPSGTSQQQAVEPQDQQASKEVTWDFNGKQYKAPAEQLMQWRVNGLRQDDYTRRVRDLLNWYQEKRDKIESIDIIDRYLKDNPEKREQVNEILFGIPKTTQTPPTNQQQANNPLQMQQPVADPLQQQAQRQSIQNWYTLQQQKEHTEDMQLRSELFHLQQKYGAMSQPQVNEVLKYMVSYNLESPELALKLWQNDFMSQRLQHMSQQQQQPAPQQVVQPVAAPVQVAPSVVGTRAGTRGIRANVSSQPSETPKDLTEALRLAKRDLRGR